MGSVREKMISVIIPIYNVEAYIEDCLKSVASQTCLKQGVQVECILVDDCGTDNSISIAEAIIDRINENEDKDENLTFKLLHHDHNRGLSAARNTGMEVAQGEYVYFVDSDDILFLDCIENLISIARIHPDAEMIVGQYDEFYEGEECHRARLMQSDGIYSGDVIGTYIEGKIPAKATNKLVRKEFLIKNNLMFEEGLVHEDALWSFHVFCLAKKVVVSDQVIYHYLQRPGSLDKQKNMNLHATHYNRVHCLQAKFVFEHGLQNDTRLFRFIEKARYQLLTDASLNDRDLGYDLYKETRKYPYWGQFHRFLPCWVGYIAYIRVRCWWLKVKR